MRKALVMLAVTLSGALVQAATSAESCARLGELAIPGAKITAAAIVKAGAFISPTAEPQPAEAAIYRGLTGLLPSSGGSDSKQRFRYQD